MLDTTSTALDGRTVLLLGADAATRTREAAMLRDLGAARVVEAETLGAALAALGANDASIAFLDVESGGLDLLRFVRSAPATADMRVVLITSAPSGATAVAGRDLRANDILVRPYDLGDLAETVKPDAED